LIDDYKHLPLFISGLVAHATKGSGGKWSWSGRRCRL